MRMWKVLEAVRRGAPRQWTTRDSKLVQQKVGARVMSTTGPARLVEYDPKSPFTSLGVMAPVAGMAFSAVCWYFGIGEDTQQSIGVQIGVVLPLVVGAIGGIIGRIRARR